MNHQLLALYGLKWNPFAPELPLEALRVTPKLENFCWRIEQALVREGGFAVIQGDPGTGKSVALRLLAERLTRLTDLTVGVLTHPQSNLADFYRELGDLFSVSLQPHNRWGGFKTLRERSLRPSRIDAPAPRLADRRSPGHDSLRPLGITPPRSLSDFLPLRVRCFYAA